MVDQNEPNGEPNGEPNKIVIKFKPVEETSTGIEIKEVTTKARAVALEKLGGASNLSDYLRWHRAAQLITPSNISWAWDEKWGGEGYKAEELITEQETEASKKQADQNSAATEEMKTTITSAESKPGMVKVALKRVRNETGRYTYRALAAFPEKSISDPLDGAIEGYRQRSGEDIILFEPENACVEHACDDLFKEHRNNAFYMPLKDLDVAISQLQQGGQRENEYLIAKTDAGNITQDAQNFLLVGLMGGYSNERLRTRVSDFWNKQAA